MYEVYLLSGGKWVREGERTTGPRKSVVAMVRGWFPRDSKSQWKVRRIK